MKKIFCLLLAAVLALTITLACANGYTLPEKMRIQLQVGNGLKGSFAVHANADPQDDPFLYTVQNAEYEIRGEMVLGSEDLHYYIYQLDDEEQVTNKTELYRKDGIYYLRSDFLDGRVYSLPDQDKMIDSLTGAAGENPSILPALIKVLCLPEEEKAAWEPIAERLGKKIEMWMSGFSPKTSYTTKEGEALSLTISYTIPMNAVFQFIPELAVTTRNDSEAMSLIRNILTAEEMELYLNENLTYFYQEALSQLNLQGNLFYSKTMSTMGDVISTTAEMPLDSEKTGYNLLTVHADGTFLTYALTGEKKLIQVSLPAKLNLNEAETETQATLIRISENENEKESNRSIRLYLKKTHTETEDEENAKSYEYDHYSLTVEKDLSILPDDVNAELIPPYETMQAELDLHYSSKHDPGKPTTLEFDLSRTQGNKTLSVTGMIKTAESWPFLPFSTDSAEILDITQTEAIENMIAQWAAGAITGIRHLPGETAEEE